MSSNNTRIAQFGGVGGGYNGSSFAPGKSPIGRGGTNPGGWDINNFVDEEVTTNKRLEKLHFEPNLVESIEKQLSAFHNDAESEKNYVSVLTPEERQREEFRKKLHDYKQSLLEEANTLRMNSPAYIKEHFKPRPEHLRTIQESLEAEGRHKYKQDQKFEREDESPDQEKPTRYHIAITDNQIARIAQEFETKRRRNEILERLPGEKSPGDIQFTDPSLGPTPVLVDGSQFDKYINDLKNVNTPDDDGYYEYELKDTVLSYPDPDTLPNNLTPGSVSKSTPLLDTDLSIEGNLNSQLSPQDRLKRNNPTFKEKMGVEDVYEGSPFYGLHTNQVFK